VDVADKAIALVVGTWPGDCRQYVAPVVDIADHFFGKRATSQIAIAGNRKNRVATAAFGVSGLAMFCSQRK
jgi:hypothetical protein